MKFAVKVTNAIFYTPRLILGIVDLAKVGLEVISDQKYMRGYNAGYDEALKKLT